MPSLKIENLSKSFGGLMAVNHVTFEVAGGEILGLIGPNGSGKTTLFNLISGFLPPDTGSIYFEGESLVGLKPHQICKRGIGRTFQIVKPFPHLSVMRNVRAAVFNRGKEIKQANRQSESLLEFVGLWLKRNELPGSLTLAERKQLELARCLATQPKFLLLDEVMAGLNPVEQKQMIELVIKIREGGVTIIVIEHTMRIVMTISDRILVLCFGEIIAQGGPREVAQDPDVIKSYLGEKYRFV
ncbi:MAG TPA: ABC transporter ATP-binding protein [Thermodesulfobacteriota bacterium]|nr:ABC transporter ATP-binding protein [Thermodesulfobacteriota bacterium]